MKIEPTKYGIGQQVLIRGGGLDIERVLTINHIQVRVDKDADVLTWYGFEESKWMHRENEIKKSVKALG